MTGPFATEPTPQIFPSLNAWLMGEVAFLGLENMDVDKIVAHIQGLQTEPWCPLIEESRLRQLKYQNLTNIITAFSAQLQSTEELFYTQADIHLVQTAILLGFVDSNEPENAAQIVQDLMAENWFPHITSASVLYQKLRVISSIFGGLELPALEEGIELATRSNTEPPPHLSASAHVTRVSSLSRPKASLPNFEILMRQDEKTRQARTLRGFRPKMSSLLEPLWTPPKLDLHSLRAQLEELRKGVG
ncbi:hypothetical protein FB45DRAFT_864677 [Roridomyces roridus]|uniref:Uncharacterized protein n=1 Tax=Roridomyces roridus TaxID=1738132 RepID=A0AAD7FPV7_9AGAR|nr:hypothetical protein FB45DRAFT_864677 [Roridomyces roridus]